MTDDEYLQLEKRVVNGKAWIEKIKAEGIYWTPATQRHIELWFRLTDRLIEEDKKRAHSILNKEQEKKGLVYFEGEWHSKAWVMMKEVEKEDEQRRLKARIRARERAEQKRKGIK